MATRNERKRRAKLRHAELKAAVNEAFLTDKANRPKEHKPRQDVFDTSSALRGHERPVQRFGSVTKGKFMPKLGGNERPYKRPLTLNKETGKLIERVIRYVK